MARGAGVGWRITMLTRAILAVLVPVAHRSVSTAGVAALLLIVSCSNSGETPDTADGPRGREVAAGVDGSTPSGPVIGQEPSRTTSPERLTGASLRQRFDPEGYADVLAFWAPVAGSYGAALEPEYFEYLDEMIISANVVVVGEISWAGVTRTVGDPEGVEAPPVSFWGIELKVLSVLSGELDPNSGKETIIVETHVTPGDLLPTGAGVFALRHKLDMRFRQDQLPSSRDRPPPEGEDDKYRLVSSQGVFFDSSEGIKNPIIDALTAGEAGDDDRYRDPVAQEVRGLSVDQLIEEIVRAGGDR